MKKKYTSPEIELEATEARDIIMSSTEPEFAVDANEGWLDIWA